MNFMTPIDRSAFDAQLVAQLESMRGYAIKLTRTSEGADDLLNQTALRAIRAWTQFQPGTNFKAWIFQILRNEFLDGLRRNRRAPEQMPDVDSLAEALGAQPAGQDDAVWRADIRTAMNRLPIECRHVLMAICVQGLTYEEYAAYIEAPVGVVKSRLWRARARLAELLA